MAETQNPFAAAAELKDETEERGFLALAKCLEQLAAGYVPNDEEAAHVDAARAASRALTCTTKRRVAKTERPASSRTLAFALWVQTCVARAHVSHASYLTDDASLSWYEEFVDPAKCRALSIQEFKCSNDSTLSAPICTLSSTELVYALDVFTWRLTEFSPHATPERSQQAHDLFVRLRSRAMTFVAYAVSPEMLSPEHTCSLGAVESGRECASVAFVDELRAFLDCIEDELRAATPAAAALTLEERAAVQKLREVVVERLMPPHADAFVIRKPLHDFIARSRLLKCDAEIQKIREPHGAVLSPIDLVIKKNEFEAALPPTKPPNEVRTIVGPAVFDDFALSFLFANSTNSRTGRINGIGLMDALRGAVRKNNLGGVFVVDGVAFPSLIQAFCVARMRKLLPDFYHLRNEAGERVGVERDLTVFDSVILG